MVGLLLSLAGASISLVLLIIEKKESRKRRAILALATAGFLVFLGQQFLSYFSAKASEQIFNSLNERTKEINTKTTRIDSTVTVMQLFMSKLTSTGIDKIGVRVESLDDLENLHAFEKGSPETWSVYLNWLMSSATGKKALKFTVNTNREYNYSLVLLYLMTDRNNHEFVRNIINSYSSWPHFPKSSDISSIESSDPLCDLVIFERNNGEILGFASAKDLLKNLTQLNNRQEFERALNSVNSDFKNFAINNLTSFHLSANGRSLEEVASSMINNNISQTVNDIDSKCYYLDLSNMFKLQ